MRASLPPASHSSPQQPACSTRHQHQQHLLFARRAHQPVGRAARAPPVDASPTRVTLLQPARFKAGDELQQLVDAARQGPVVQLPAVGDPQQQQPLDAQQLQQPAVPDRRLRPSRMDFAVMLAQLTAWRGRFLTAHVPRHCFDAPELGAWVRHMRKQHAEGRLEQWKVERLNELAFEWELLDVDAKWHHQYHQLRRYRALHGSSAVVDVSRSAQDGCDWAALAKWLGKQSQLLAKQRLSSQKRAMLQQLGVTLTIPKRLVQRTAALQALNGPERRKLRKKWKLQDRLAAEARWEQHQVALQEQQAAERQQRELLQRRQELQRQARLQAAQEGAATAAAAQQPAQQQQHQQQGPHPGPATSSAAHAGEQLPSSSQPQPPPQQQQQQLLYQRNRRRNRVKHRSRQEQWLEQQDASST